MGLDVVGTTYSGCALRISRDGGKTWEKVLYKGAKTGAIDITFDPTNANILFASLWQAKRTPWSMDSGGPGSGL